MLRAPLGNFFAVKKSSHVSLTIDFAKDVYTVTIFLILNGRQNVITYNQRDA